jgi:hypothetical protein
MENIEDFREWSAQEDWYLKNIENIKLKHPNTWVAVIDCNVVGTGSTLAQASNAANDYRKRTKSTQSAFIGFTGVSSPPCITCV